MARDALTGESAPCAWHAWLVRLAVPSFRAVPHRPRHAVRGARSSRSAPRAFAEARVHRDQRRPSRRRAPYRSTCFSIRPTARAATARRNFRGTTRPPSTRSFAVTIFDPDAPGRGWWHWAVAGIPATVDAACRRTRAPPASCARLGAVEARNDFDTDGYGGPCPPPGKPHRYVITVYALNTADLRLAQGRPALMFEHEIRTTTLGSAQTRGHLRAVDSTRRAPCRWRADRRNWLC